MVEYCTCGHTKECHAILHGPHGIKNLALCLNCVNKNEIASHSFKLDNLKLIEDLAKEKGLV